MNAERSGLILRFCRTVGLVLLIQMVGCDSSEPAPAPVLYTVVRGDTLTRIAGKHGVTVEALRQANGISGDLIEVGQVLTISLDGATAVSKKRSGKSGGIQKRGAASRSSMPPLKMPPAKKCLAGPSLDGPDGDEAQMVGSAGLTHAQLSAAMNQSVGRTQRCIDGQWPQGVITLSITVACSGRVSALSTLDGGGTDPALVDCVEKVLRTTAFPAHDVPDGFTFTYPLRFSSGAP